jgi:TolA-binding protein
MSMRVMGWTIAVYRGGHAPPFSILHTLAQMEQRMTKIEDKLTEVSNVLDSVAAGVANLQGDVSTLNGEIQSLKDQLSGNLTPEQEAAFDSVIAKATALKTAVDALDALTPPAASTDQPSA